jgi:type VII secretion-associated serine protease mycosin
VALLAMTGGAALAPGPVAAQEPHDQLAALGAAEAWQYSTGEGVTVAVLDSGVDGEHPDLAGRVLPGTDLVDGSTDGRVDPVGHGTAVASLVAGAGDPAIGLAPDARILPVRVLDEQNRYRSAATVAEGVIWAVEHGAEVINMSLGGARESPVLADALAYAMDRDVVVVACTGNATGDEYQEVWYPAREPGVVAVSGLAGSDGWRLSLTGPETVLGAPAVVTGAQVGGGYREARGTSFSSALVAGAAALIRARWQELSAADVVNRLVATARDVADPGRDQVSGFGAVDPVAALTRDVPAVAANPLDTKARHRTTGLGAAPTAAPSAPPPSPAPERAERPPAQRGGAAGIAWVVVSSLTAVLSVAAGRRLSRR